MPAVKDKKPEAIETPPDPVYTWKMPEIHIGDNIVWYREGDTNSGPNHGIVVSMPIGGRAVDVSVQSRDSMFRRYDCRHIDDPILYKLDFEQSKKQNGTWDYAESRKKLLELEKRVEFLEQMGT